jgi:hypothetical protein
MDMPVHGQSFASFPALDCTDGSPKVRSDLLPGIQTIVRLGICKNGDAVGVGRVDDGVLSGGLASVSLSFAPYGNLGLADALFLLYLLYFLARLCFCPASGVTGVRRRRSTRAPLLVFGFRRSVE